jgi:flagellar basal-body rod modification protein FlgD
MTTTPTSSSTSSAGSTVANAAGLASAQTLSGNFDTFLQLLTTQLQNQDPLDPMDSNSFTQELVEFASVEQQVNTNTSLQTLISMQQTTEATSAMQLMGANVSVNGNVAALSNATSTSAQWTFSSPSPATANVTITSSTGQVAFTGTVSLNAGSNTYTWNGQGANGVTWPDGNYTMAINATGANGQPVTVTTQVQGTISGVNVSQNPPQITVGGQSYPITAIQSINSNSLNSGLNNLGSLNSTISSLNSTLSSLTQLL